MDTTLLVGCIAAGATVIAAIIMVGVNITPRYTLQKDRRERIDRYRVGGVNGW